MRGMRGGVRVARRGRRGRLPIVSEMQAVSALVFGDVARRDRAVQRRKEKMKKYEARAAKCPFYRRESGSVVFCEGTEGCNAIHVAFSARALKKKYASAFCRGEYPECLIARALTEIKYGNVLDN